MNRKNIACLAVGIACVAATGIVGVTNAESSNATIEHFNDSISVICDNTKVNSVTKPHVYYTGQQQVGWLKATDSDGKQYWFYSEDGTNIIVGHFRVNGEGYFADYKTGKLLCDGWECNNEIITDIHSAVAGTDYVTARTNHYDTDGKLIPNYKADLAGGSQEASTGHYQYADGLTVNYEQNIANAWTTETAKLASYHKPGFIRTQDSLGKEIILYTEDGYKLATGAIQINGSDFYFDKYTGELTNEVYVAQGTMMQYKNTNGIPSSDLMYFKSYNIPKDVENVTTTVTDSQPMKVDTPSTGIIRNGWVKEFGKWKYMNSNANAVKGWAKSNGNWYLLDRQNGTMKTGWAYDNGRWYYLANDGAMERGWIKDGGTWYYLNSNGSMRTGWYKEGNTWYYLNTNGSMKTGWDKINNAWYYFNGSGAMKTGWLQLNSSWYYLNSNGKMVDYNFKLNGQIYKVDSSGVCRW